MEELNEKVTVNDQEMSKEKFQEVKENLKSSERLTEVNPNGFRKLERMTG